MSTFPIHHALLDERLLGAALGPVTTWETWLATLKAAFALPLSETEAGTFHAVAGGRTPPNTRVRELWCVAGRRSGKSRMAAAIAAYAAAFNQHKLAVGEVGTVLVLAASQAQAQTVFQYALGFLEASEVLRREIASVTATEIRLRSGIVIAVHPNSFRTLRGKSLLCCVMDEVSMWRSEESATPDVEVYRAVLPSLATTNGMLIAISTPYRKSGLLYQKHRDCFARDSDGVLVVQGPSLTFNPTLNTAVVDAAIADDREGAASEWEATFRTDISALLDDATIDACIGDRPLELPPRKEIRYSCFVDSSAGRHDSFCCALAHKEGETCVIDLVRGRSAPFDPDQVAQEYAQLAKEYKCTEIVGDNFAGEWVAGAFKRAGIRYRRADKVKSQIYLECLPLFARGQLNLPDHPKLMRELRLLERHTARSGKDRVDHGRNGSDDYANAAMGALVLLTHARMPNYPYITDWDGNLVFDGRPKQSAYAANEQSAPDSARHQSDEPLDERWFKRIPTLRLW